MRIGKATVGIDDRDVTRLGADAVVNPANTMLWMGGGVSSAIRHAAGETVEREAMSKAPVPPGEAVVTSAGDMNSRWIVHAVVAGQDLKTDPDVILRATKAALAAADGVGASSLALPMLDAGHPGVEVHVAARGMVEATVGYLLGGNGNLTSVLFTDPDPERRRILADTLMEMFTRHG